MKMYLLSGGRLRMRKSVFLPDADRSETIELPVYGALFRHPQGNVLFDTGCHPSLPDTAETRWGGLARLMTPIMARGDDIVTSLAGIGLQCDDIDVVVCSHLHPDHCGCNTFFKRASFIVHAKEVAATRAPQADKIGYLAAEWEGAGALDMIDGQRDIFGDGRIVLVPLPGHTPGTIGAMATLDRDGKFFLPSDTVSLRSTLDTGVIPKNTWNADALAKSLDEVRRIEANDATVLCSHDDAQWTALRKGADTYE
ncbi:MAG TPA: N-acyl homoserine lactonase family protein [Xanthobacteraceae bacterium]|jgi:glyoxylase-like metal-dependent hydrolase (beta-lactamase superfamily II)|nr:N-acyl homoserine lactonase family protein [Xanthobacteraceae bacterium]